MTAIGPVRGDGVIEDSMVRHISRPEPHDNKNPVSVWPSQRRQWESTSNVLVNDILPLHSRGFCPRYSHEN